MAQKSNRFQFGYLLLGLLLIAVGVLFIVFEGVLEKLALTLGIILILYAAYLLVVALSHEKRGALFVIRLVIAFAVLVGGALTIIFREDVGNHLLALFALVLIIDGSFKLQLTANLKTYTLPLFWVMLVLATGVIAGGFIAIRYPLSKNDLFLGLLLVLDGISNLFSPFGRASCEKAARAIRIVGDADVSSEDLVTEESSVSESDFESDSDSGF